MTRWIGIDPDVDQSGFAVWNDVSQQFETIDQASFFQITLIVSTIAKTRDVKIIIEAGWLIKKSNWHGRKGQSKAVGEKIAQAVGRNHQVGKLFAEFCQTNDIAYELQKPLGKVDGNRFKAITGWNEVTNPEKRDAAMLVFKR